MWLSKTHTDPQEALVHRNAPMTPRGRMIMIERIADLLAPHVGAITRTMQDNRVARGPSLREARVRFRVVFSDPRPCLTSVIRVNHAVNQFASRWFAGMRGEAQPQCRHQVLCARRRTAA